MVPKSRRSRLIVMALEEAMVAGLKDFVEPAGGVYV